MTAQQTWLSTNLAASVNTAVALRPGAAHAHLVGIAGSGMAALAQVLDDWGWQLSGSDLAPPAVLAELRNRHQAVYSGHAGNQVPPDADLLVYSDAIPADNPELRRAAELGIPRYSYFEMIGRLAARQQLLALAGTHGKSTTTAMAAEILAWAGCDPTVFCGAAPLGKTSGGRGGRGPLMLAEACEYRSHFLHLQPQAAVILGIEPDHFDCFASLAELHDAFARFAGRVPPHGWLLVRHECAVSRAASGGAACRVETFGLDSQADWTVRNVSLDAGRPRFEIVHRGRRLARVELAVPGRHNVLNALAAAALTSHYGVAPHEIAAGLRQMGGLRRRLERLEPADGVERWDDYAHHPTEVAAALQTLRDLFPGRRLWAVFQPHQASRTARLLDEFAASLDNCDRLLLAEIFRAREPAWRPGDVSVADLARRVRQRGNDVPDAHDLVTIAAALRQELRPGDVLLTLGAGDVRKLYEHLNPKS